MSSQHCQNGELAAAINFSEFQILFRGQMKDLLSLPLESEMHNL